MKQYLPMVLLLAVASLSLGCVGDNTLRLKPSPIPTTGPNQPHNVAGALRAQSPHYKLVGALVPEGGTQTSQSFSVHTGVLGTFGEKQGGKP
jgi:hypothetical protein